MRTITKTYELYKYDELSDKAKKAVKQWYLDSQEADVFTDMCMENLNELFPNSDLKVEYSLSYCQGDGFNIYGEISLSDLLDNLKNHFKQKEINKLKTLFSEYASTYDMECNRRYSYCICGRHNYMENIITDMEDNDIENIPYDLLYRFNSLSQDYLSELCKIYENDGYEYFYKISEEDLKDYCDANDYEFYKDGKIA